MQRRGGGGAEPQRGARAKQAARAPPRGVCLLSHGAAARAELATRASSSSQHDPARPHWQRRRVRQPRRGRGEREGPCGKGSGRAPVSQICALMILPSCWMLRVANSTPMVDLESRWNSLRVKRLNRLDLPTPESPMITTARAGEALRSAQAGARSRWSQGYSTGQRAGVPWRRTFEEVVVVVVRTRRGACGGRAKARLSSLRAGLRGGLSRRVCGAAEGSARGALSRRRDKRGTGAQAAGERRRARLPS